MTIYEQNKLMQEISYLSSKLASTEAGYEKLKNDFESRTCDNCEYHKLEYGMFLCNYHEIDYYNPVYGKFTGKDYGCLKFKRKQDETNQ